VIPVISELAERRFGRPVGIRLRATVIATAVVAGALLGGGALLVGLVHRSLIGSLDAAGQARARDVAAVAGTGRQSTTVASTGEESSVVQVVDKAGQVLAASPNSTGEPPLLTAPPARPIRQVLTRTDSGTYQLLTRLSQQATRMAELLHDLLFLARSDDNTARQYHQSVDLDELVLHEAHRLRALGATITLDGPDAVRLPGSANELSRLLRNLGDNALTHTRTHITLGLHHDDTHAVLTVTDDGPGIAPNDRERIFARFSRLDTARTHTPAGGGTGLGLAISRQIAQRHHGSITVNDSPTTTFTVRLPLPHAAPTEGPDSAPRPPA